MTVPAPTPSAGTAEVHERMQAIEQRVTSHPAFADLLARAGRAATAAPEPSPARADDDGVGIGAPAEGRDPPTVAASALAAQRTEPAGGDGATTAAAAPGEGADEGDDPAVGAWAQRLPSAGRAWAPAIQEAAQRHGVQPERFAALVWAESGFRPDAVSHTGATGLAQLMPDTAAGLGVDRTDPHDNLDGGARYLAAQQQRFGDDALALAAYNAGPGRVERAGGVPDITETRTYVDRVADYTRRLEGEAA